MPLPRREWGGQLDDGGNVVGAGPTAAAQRIDQPLFRERLDLCAWKSDCVIRNVIFLLRVAQCWAPLILVKWYIQRWSGKASQLIRIHTVREKTAWLHTYV